MLSRILQRVKDPMFLQMYKLLEEKYLPPSLSEGFKQVSDITSSNEINKITINLVKLSFSRQFLRRSARRIS